MARECIVCNKVAASGFKYRRRGQIKRTGGAGSKIVGKTLRKFLPNLQKIKINVKGTVLTALVCTSCISAGKITKA